MLFHLEVEIPNTKEAILDLAMYVKTKQIDAVVMGDTPIKFTGMMEHVAIKEDDGSLPLEVACAIMG
jgi:hypothetical protein